MPRGAGMDQSLSRRLGYYLLAAAAFDAVVLALAATNQKIFEVGLLRHVGISLIFPRVAAILGERAWLLIEAGSTVWLFTLGGLLICRRRPLRTYVCSELLLVAPTVYVAIMLVVFGGGHVLFRSDGWTMLSVFLVCTAIPVALAFRCLRVS